MSPHLRGRVDLDKYGKACQRLENFIPSLQGPITYRPGTRVVADLSSEAVIIPFISGSDTHFTIILQPNKLTIYNREGVFQGDTITAFSASELKDVDHHQEVNEVHFSHGNHPPTRLVINELKPTPLVDSAGVTLTDSDGFILTATNSLNLGSESWYYEETVFKAHPFLKEDTSGVVMKMAPNEEVIKLVSTNPFEFDGIQLNHGISTRPIYVEYRSGDVWGIGRVLGLNSSPAAPQDPAGSVCYIEPVDKVVDIKDMSADYYPVINDGTHQSTHGNLFNFFGVPQNKGGVFCDTAVFESKHRGAWLRISSDRLLSRRIPQGAVDDQIRFYTGSNPDTLPMWIKIDEHVGLRDIPVEFLNYENGVSDQQMYEAGNVYQVLRWGDRAGPITIKDALGNTAALVTRGSSSRRFAMNATATFGEGGDGGFITADASRMIQVDVVLFNIADGFYYRQPKTTGGSGGFVISPTGSITVVDNTNKEPTETGVRNRATITATEEYFDQGRDTGRYFYGRIQTSWVLARILSVTNDRTAVIDIRSAVPISEKTGKLLNDGSFSSFRMGAWFPGNWPRTVTFYERRRVYAGTALDPNYVWLSKMADQTDFRPTEDDGEVLDTTAIAYPLGTASMVIRWLSPGATLVVGTNSGEWQLRPNEFAGAVTPENIRISEETQIGSLNIKYRVGGSVFFSDRSAKSVYEFYFDPQMQGFMVRTVTKLVDTLFEDDPIQGIYYQHYPYSAFWAPLQSGKVALLVYRKEDDFYAWSIIDFGGVVESVTVLPRDKYEEDRVWLVVRRGTKRHIEVVDTLKTTAFLDAARVFALGQLVSVHLESPLVTIEGGEVVMGLEGGYSATLSVQGYFEPGEIVAAIADGQYLGQYTVNAQGFLDFEQPVEAARIVVGYPYEGAAQLMPFAWEMQGKLAYGQLKRLVSMRPYLRKSKNYFAGMQDSEMEHFNLAQGAEFTGFGEDVPVPAAQFSPEATPIIKQLLPQPLTVVSLALKFDAN